MCRSDLIVKFMIKGSAVNSADYKLLKDTLEVRAGKKSAQIQIVPKSDLGGAAVKTVVLTLKPGTGYKVGTIGKVEARILAKP